MADLDLCFTPASELTRLICSKELSPVEIVANALERIGAVNPAINAFCFVYGDEAMAEARRAEDALAGDRALGPLHGVPVALKDSTPIEGKTATSGSRVFERWVAERDSVLVERLRAAGAIILGKTTLPEFAASGWTESDLWGITRNPWNLDRTPGGSSGGSAAAVAAGCVPLAEGTDHGGSVRAPAALCGVVGLRPSRGRIPMDLLPTAFEPYLTFGPLARSVGDAALFLDATHGPDPRDFYSLPLPFELERPIAIDLRGKKLALSLNLGYLAIAADVQAETRAAVAALSDLGASVEEVELNIGHEVTRWIDDVWHAMSGAFFRQYLDEWRDKMDPYNVMSIEQGWRIPAAAVRRHEPMWTRLWHEVSAILEIYDAILCPTTATVARPVNTRDADFPETDDRGRYWGRPTEPFSLLYHCPALSVPSGWTADGLPVGLQIIGRRFDDAGVLRVAAALESARPWADRRPPL